MAWNDYTDTLFTDLKGNHLKSIHMGDIQDQNLLDTPYICCTALSSYRLFYGSTGVLGNSSFVQNILLWYIVTYSIKDVVCVSDFSIDNYSK